MPSVPPRPVFPYRLFFLLFSAVAALILAGAWYVGHERIVSEQDITRSSEIGAVIMGVRRLDDDLHAPFQQLRTLARDAAVRRGIDGGAGSDMAAVFATLIHFNDRIDHVTWIDESGMERVRVNNEGGEPVTVAGDQLRNKSERYYFREALRLKPGQMYVSPLDLSVDQGKVEVPHKPMLRLATPVRDAQERSRGILVIHVAARHLIDAFTDSLIGARDHVMLLNREGYWLVSPNSEDAWGFMFDRRDTLGSRHPAAWASISSIPSGQVELPDGLWTWSTVYPLKTRDSDAVSEIPRWLVVAHLPDSQLAMIRKGAWTAVGINTLILLLLFGALCAWLARALNGRAQALVEVSLAHAEAEAARRLSDAHQRFRLVVEANAAGLLVVDVRGQIVMANAALTRMFGYSGDELIGQPMEILLPEADRDRHGRLRAGYMEAPLPRPMGAGRDLYGRRKDGSILQVEISLSSFVENGQQFVDAVVVDITERKRVERLQQASQMRLQLLLETNPNGVLVVDDQGMITLTNPALNRMFGYAHGELMNRPVDMLVPEVSRDRHAQLREHYMKAPSTRPMGAGLHLQGQRKDGGTFPIAVSLASFEEEGRTFTQATIIDASTR